MKLKIFGIEVSFHWSMLIMLLIIASLNIGLWGSVLLWVVLYSSILAHEFGHAMTANRLGARCKKIILMALGGVALNEIPQKLKPRLITYAMGPAVTFVLSIISVTMLLLFEPENMAIRYCLVINPCLFVFNIIPIYPLDGGGMMYCIIRMKTCNEIVACRRTAIVSFIFIALLATYAVCVVSLWLLMFCVIFILKNRMLYSEGENPSATKCGGLFKRKW